METVSVTRRYTLKADPHSSHSVMLAWLGAGQGRRLLDVGSADGLLSRSLSDAGWRVTDLDREIPEFDAPFDAIVCGDVLEHLVDPLRTVVGLNRWLAPGGRVVISVPNVAHLLIRLSLLVGRFDYFDRGILDRTHLRFFTDRSLRRLLGAAGLVIVRRTATAVPLYQVVPAAWHGRLLDAVHAVSAAFSRMFPRLLGYQFVVVAERGTWP
jgi:2-polyprenyl-3-methyl-5-hydroxy-6-metoxy-1,4-benzoquinol methylase